MRKVKILIEQESNIIEVDSDEYLYLLKILGYDSEILADTPPYEGNMIVINGDLDVSNTPITSLHNVVKINGRLKIDNTNISDISKIDIPSHKVSDFGSKRQLIRIRKLREEKLSLAQQRRDDNEWDLNNPDIDYVGIMANVVFSYFQRKFPDVKIKTPEDTETINEISNEIQRLLNLEKEYKTNGRDLTDIYSEIETLEERLNELTDAIDVYNFIPDGEHYELLSFEFISENNGNEYNDYRFAVGTERDVKESLESYFQEFIDNPKEYFRKDILKEYIDTDAVVEYFRDHYDEDVRNSTDSYFDSDDYELSEEDQERLEELNDELDDYKERLEMYPDDSAEYEQIQDHIEDLESQIESIEESKEISEKQIEDKINDLVDDVENNPLYYMEEYGLDILYYLDKDKLLESLVDESDYGTLNGYDNSYDEISLNGEDYIVMNYEQ